MHLLRNQRTIADMAEVEGFGYWSGRDVRVEFHPVPADTGIVFVRTDLKPAVRIPAHVAARVEMPRRTTIAAGGARVEMIEHILAALAGLGIDNCEIAVDAPEMPGMDGSSRDFVQAIDEVGIFEFDDQRRLLVIDEVTRLGDDEMWIEARPSAAGGLTIKYRLDYGSDSAIGRQTLRLALDPDTFRRELAPSRTFMLKQEADWLLSQGLGSRTTTRDLLVFDGNGPIDNELRYENECVRHKMLDLVGDLALAGCDIVGEIVAHRSGHRLNARLIEALLSEERVIEARRKTA